MIPHHTDLTIARMNAAKDMHRARGTSGGKPRPIMTDADRHLRDEGKTAGELGLEIVAAALKEGLFLLEMADIDPDIDYLPETEIPF